MNTAIDAVDGVWELEFTGDGLMQKVIIRAHTGTFGMAQAFGDTFERMLNNIDPRIKLTEIREIGPG